MTDTAIDAAMNAFAQAIAATTGVSGRVYEDRAWRLTPQDAPAIDVRLDECNPVERLGGSHPATTVYSVRMQVALAIYVRSEIQDDGTELPTRALASHIWQSAHQLLVTDTTLAGLVSSIRWVRSTWRKDQADGTAGWAEHLYELTLAVRDLNLTLPAA